MIKLIGWRGGRVVDGSGLENQRCESIRGFESRPLRSKNKFNPANSWVFLGKTKKKGIKENSGVQIKLKNAETTHNIGY